MRRSLSPWSERREYKSESERHKFAKIASAHLPETPEPVHFSEDDIAALDAAFVKRFNEDIPRTETLMAVAHVGYRMALRDMMAGANNKSVS